MLSQTRKTFLIFFTILLHWHWHWQKIMEGSKRAVLVEKAAKIVPRSWPVEVIEVSTAVLRCIVSRCVFGTKSAICYLAVMTQAAPPAPGNSNPAPFVRHCDWLVGLPLPGIESGHSEAQILCDFCYKHIFIFSNNGLLMTMQTTSVQNSVCRISL